MEKHLREFSSFSLWIWFPEHAFSIALLYSHWYPFQSPSSICISQQTRARDKAWEGVKGTWTGCTNSFCAGALGCSGRMGSGTAETGGWALRSWAKKWHSWFSDDSMFGTYGAWLEVWPWDTRKWTSLLPSLSLQCAGYPKWSYFSYWALQENLMHAREINFLCALLHHRLFQWQKAQFTSKHVFCKNEPQE